MLTGTGKLQLQPKYLGEFLHEPHSTNNLTALALKSYRDDVSNNDMIVAIRTVIVAIRIVDKIEGIATPACFSKTQSMQK